MKYLHKNLLIVDFPDNVIDISEGLQFKSILTSPVDIGTALMPRIHLAKSVYLKVVSKKGDNAWLARWHDGSRQSGHDGQVFHLELLETANRSGLSVGTFEVHLAPTDEQQTPSQPRQPAGNGRNSGLPGLPNPIHLANPGASDN